MLSRPRRNRTRKLPPRHPAAAAATTKSHQHQAAPKAVHEQPQQHHKQQQLPSKQQQQLKTSQPHQQQQQGRPHQQQQHLAPLSAVPTPEFSTETPPTATRQSDELIGKLLASLKTPDSSSVLYPGRYTAGAGSATPSPLAPHDQHYHNYGQHSQQQHMGYTQPPLHGDGHFSGATSTAGQSAAGSPHVARRPADDDETDTWNFISNQVQSVLDDHDAPAPAFGENKSVGSHGSGNYTSPYGGGEAGAFTVTGGTHSGHTTPQPQHLHSGHASAYTQQQQQQYELIQQQQAMQQHHQQQQYMAAQPSFIAQAGQYVIMNGQMYMVATAPAGTAVAAAPQVQGQLLQGQGQQQYYAAVPQGGGMPAYYVLSQ